MYLERSVLSSYLSLLNDLLWLLYLSLDFVLVILIYETCSFSEDTVALYIIQLQNKKISSKHLDGCLQLHVFVAASMLFFSFIVLFYAFDDLLHVSCTPIPDLYSR